MSATVIAIADAVVATLNGASLTLSFTAERFYVPVYDLQKDLGTLKVPVVPHGLGAKPLSRSSDDFTYLVDVAIQKRLEKTATTQAAKKAECDGLTLLMEEILDLFRGKSLAGVNGVECMEVENEPIFIPSHLDEENVFTSVATLTFKKARNR